MKIINGILAFCLIAAVLLISDWENRSGKEVKKNNSITTKKMYKICLAQYVDSFNSEETEKGIRDELLRQGYIEGKNFTLKIFNAQGDVSTLNSISDIIANENWDIIFAASTPTIQSFSKKIKDQPIVFTNVGDPIRAGMGESFEKHLPNITGISTMSDFEGLIELVIASIPDIKTIGTVFTPGEINSVAYSEALKKAAEKHGLNLIAVPANSASEVADASKAISSRGIQAFTQISDNLTGSCYASIIKEAYNSRIPYFGFVSDQTNKGAIATLARDYYSAGTDAVKMAVQILNGKSPADIPFQFVSKTSIQVNKDAMRYFGVIIPDRYLPKENSKND